MRMTAAAEAALTAGGYKDAAKQKALSLVTCPRPCIDTAGVERVQY